ncbi:TetR/AcrR family transcriptional regulator [Leuconostoc lactis]|uniref:TetR/AcrR family transcriptional regulator n=1 Tax=Leuconostoc lactis TaxID=1246 RepID=UPI0024AD8DD7|nr:TetR/AcrR family transcriptional regulator [Leuconostoc lactis]MDI6495686.1 TetR/AcrR family transcriptional regulator [Leuconostoc lactis]
MNNKAEYSKTHVKILSGIIEIAQDKPIYEITVAELTRKIGINRGTFYLHFTDISEAIRQIEDYVIEKIVNVLETTRQRHSGDTYELDMYLSITQSIQDYWDAYVVLLGSNGDFQFTKRLRNKLMPYIGINGIQKTPKNKDIPVDMAEDIIMTNIFSIVVFWILNRPDLSGDQVASILYKTRRMNPLEIGGIL